MDRRALIKGLLVGAAAVGTQTATAGTGNSILSAIINETSLRDEDDHLIKFENIQPNPSTDIILTGRKFEYLKSTVSRLKQLRSFIGYGNFSLVGFDQALLYARRYPQIGAFSSEEIAFLDEIFHVNASDYGFLGIKVTENISSKINKRAIEKIPQTGNYLFRQESIDLYEKICKDIGKSIILTSGVRGIVKQMHLFLAKTALLKGNLSLASRSLAPPGYSFHGNGDFDVGKVGFGYRNFTEDFSKTTEYKRLEELGYAQIRYHKKNPFGVRFEPWHVKVS